VAHVATPKWITQGRSRDRLTMTNDNSEKTFGTTKEPIGFVHMLLEKRVFWPQVGAGTDELVLLLVLVKAWSKPSRNEKNTSTAYPTRKAIARGGMDGP